MRSSMMWTGLALLAMACSTETPKAPESTFAGGVVADKTMPAVGTDEWKIAAFTQAAPPEIAAHAAVMDWPDSATKSMKELRAGTNGWTCMPSTVSALGVTKVEDVGPMCLDKTWLAWADAWSKKTAPNLTSPGVAYMLMGDKGGSNKDPYAAGPTADNDWVVSGPHVMFLEPDVKKLEAMTTDHKSGGPYVMWKGTPYAHIMVPLGTGMSMPHSMHE